eukprot:g7982.t1
MESVAVEISNRERWGGSTEGITDTSGGGGGGEDDAPITSNHSMTSVQAEHGMDATAASAGEVAAAEPTSAAERGARTQVPSSSATISARIVGETMRFSREASPLLVRALATLPRKGRMLPHHGGDKESEPTPGRECTKALPRKCQCPPPSAAAGAASATPRDAAVTPPNHQWVFTGVIEALVLAGSLDATTTLCHFTAETKKSGYATGCRGTGDYFRGNLQFPGPSASPPMSPACAAGAGVGRTGGEYDASSSSPSTGSREGQNTDEVQGSAARLDRLLLIERQLELLGEHAASTATASDDGLVRTTTSFVVPFSWGSMSLLHAPTRFGGTRRKDGFDGGDGGRGGNQLRDCQAQWRAVRLDRLLSSRIVRALPGYVGCLPPRRSVGIVPTLLRWLEAGDHDVRWISVGPSEAHTHLLSALGIALSNVTSRENVVAANNSLGQRRHHCRQGDRRHGQPEGEIEAVGEEREEVSCDGVVAVASAVASATMRMMSSSDKEGVVDTGLFPQLCALITHVVDLLLRLIFRKQQRRLAQLPVPLGSHSQPRTHLAASTPGQSGVDSTLEFCTLVKSLLRAVAEHLVQWYPEQQAEVMESGKEDQDNTQADVIEPTQSGGGGGSDWDDWDDDDDEDDDATVRRSAATPRDVADGRHVCSAAQNLKPDSVRLCAALRAAAALMRSSTRIFAAAAETYGGRASSSTSANDTLSKFSSSKEEEEEEEGELHPFQVDLAPTPMMMPADIVVGADKQRAEGLTQRTRAKLADHGSSPSNLDHFPPSLEAALDGLEARHRRALLRAWALSAGVTSPRGT